VLISPGIAHLFSVSSRERGYAYAQHGRVRLITVMPTAVDAVVRGHEMYKVHVGCEPNPGARVQELEVSCTCPYYLDGPGTCKHIWATIVVAAGQPGSFLTALEHAAPGSIEAVPFTDGSLDEGGEPDFLHGRQIAGAAAVHTARRPAAPPLTPGRRFLAAVTSALATAPPVSVPFRYGKDELIYVLDLDTARQAGGLHIEVLTRHPKKGGGWSQPRPPRITPLDLQAAPREDAEILSALAGATQAAGGYGGSYSLQYSFALPTALARVVIPLIGKTGRAHLRQAGDESIDNPPFPVTWDDGPPWTYRVDAEPHEQGLLISGGFVRGDDIVPSGDLLMVLESGFLLTRTTIARAVLPRSRALLTALLKAGSVELEVDEAATLAHAIAQSGASSDDLPAPLRVPEIDVAPVRRLSLSPTPSWGSRDQLAAVVSFDYDGTILQAGADLSVWDAVRRRLVRRRVDDEAAAMAQLATLGLTRRWNPYEQGQTWFVSTAAMPRLVRTLVAEGWHVEAEGRLLQRPSRVTMSVASGIDWFDLHANVEFSGETVPLTDVLAALKRGDASVRLGDGSMGLLPEEWLQRYAPLAAMGETDGDRLRFRLSQTALLDALLSAQADETAVTIDATFDAARQALARFDRIEPAEPSVSFHGTLRPYQKEGLGWFAFLRQFRFGGCLADDMGLGKTVMVLAMLDARRRAARAAGAEAPASGNIASAPSLVVAPRSIIHNWIAEAARFTPELRVHDYSHATRRSAGIPWDDVDVVLATYGTLVRDVGELKEREFDYVILDEAQAIKNAGTASAKAARLLRGRHRLALSGTPIENHLGELWSLIEFLNPGLLGRSNVFAGASGGRRTVDADTANVLARALRPFILRRTKAEVAADLPLRTEQTILCELEGKQRTFYNALRAHYRDALLGRIDRVGLGKSKLQVLEALLRLRQAACHPGLVDADLTKTSSAKLEALLPMLREVVDEGHKAIVFSQFTSFLALVREALDKAHLSFEYLDGQTRDRAARVERFQTDPDCRLFLISLKAGGLGLNLTAAEYVFLLDPWWNPAVEAQAIDRAHRIGQTRHVFAYRLIAQDTVEEKVLELQQTKRALADAILRADAGLVAQLRREDLELLLS
jgi:superfamily II DNA or RNA helicase